MDIQTTVSPDDADGVIVVTLRGELTLESAPSVRATLLKCFAQVPDAVIVDVGGLRAATRSQLTVFPAAVHAQNVPVALLLCRASPGLSALINGRGLRDVLVYDTCDHALSAVRAAQVHAPYRVRMHLTANPAAPAAARDVVTATCRDWEIEHLAGPASVVVSELVSNAVQHAGTDLDLTAALRGDHLHLRVHDGSTRPPVLREDADGPDGGLLSERGRGLRLVDTYATAWGYRVSGDGKTVWATFRARPIGTADW